MADVTLKINQQTVKFINSDELVGVKPAPGVDPALAAASAGLPPETFTNSPSLGGFKLVPLDSGRRNYEDLLAKMREKGTIEVATRVYYTSEDKVPFVPTGTIYAKFKNNISDAAIADLLTKHNLVFIEKAENGAFTLGITPAAKNPMDTCVALQKETAVIAAEPDMATPAKLCANAIAVTDPLLKDQWHLENTGNHRGTTNGFKRGADARVVKAWRKGQTVGSPNIVVAVIDDGFDIDHPDLGGASKVVSPFDFTTRTPDPKPKNFSRYDDKSDWHGTACAGVAVGTNNGSGIVGAAPGCKLMPLRWGALEPVEVAKWFRYAASHGASVISCSWAANAAKYALPERISDALKEVATTGRDGKGCVICFAAGNENRDIDDGQFSLNGFAVHPDVIAVSATTSLDERSDYSNFGKQIWVCAPSNGAGGWGILTSDVTGEFTYRGDRYSSGYDDGDFTYDFGGTSSATPLVAGICALILSVKPELTAAKVKDVLKRTARKVGDGYNASGHSKYFGYGCIDAEAAIDDIM